MDKKFDSHEFKVLECIFKARVTQENCVEESFILKSLENAGINEPRMARHAFLRLEEKGYIREELHSNRGYLLTEMGERLFDLEKPLIENPNIPKKQVGNIDTKPYLLNIPAPLYKKVKMKLVEEDKNLRSVLIDALTQYIQD